MDGGHKRIRVEKKGHVKSSSAVKKKNEKVKHPPGKIKLANALRRLLEEKDFNSITTAEIANTAGTNEALIYRYFGDKRGLLHQILSEYMEEFKKNTRSYSKKIKKPIEHLRQLIFDCIDHYNQNRVFARIIFIESRNFAGFFQSETYELVKDFARLVASIIKKGIEKGEIRDNIPANYIRDTILGGVEHFVLPAVLVGRAIDSKVLADTLCEIVFNGISTVPK
jgi:TetR/AcrR family transcriptional regulator, fatty acid metabolism regulator protein